ncbi:PTS system IIB component (L-Asc family) [Orenia metallireducens]|uniref:PTS system IIB component, L-Asc family n=1 Tax=Orenia metallireducens TaxID=1413210 RepID=A0A285FYI6_9FIRM|nr:PTS sugar transporter subunit IIB [Orenia metallireducens]PRX35537.1 PTS system IIB component (L-Asc family) [Orenia metallireducens]SNY16153.1 PTS system IIB component, L-Asc family [Orenia metallireducens]
MRVVVACGNGMGTSQIMKMKAKKVFKKLDIAIDIDHMSIGQAKTAAKDYDVVICSEALTSNFNITNNKTKLIGLKNLLSEAEMEEKIKETLDI